MSIFVCSKCGNIGEKKGLINCKCGKSIDSDELYPILSACDFISTARELYEKCKLCDKNNKKEVNQLLKKHREIKISMNDLDNYILLYEKYLCNEKYNSFDGITCTMDKFEDHILEKHNQMAENATSISSAFVVFWRNKLRKPFVIMVASSIEMLFNDFFKTLLKSKLEENGAKLLLSKYKYSGIQECIDICNAFTNGSLKKEMDSIRPGFFDKWKSLRDDRNAIVHSNNKYITMKRTIDINKLIQESIDVFSTLKSRVYKNNI